MDRQMTVALDRYLTTPPDDGESAMDAYYADMTARERRYRAELAIHHYGAVAFDLDDPIEACPFEEWEWEYKIWRNGYQDAQAVATGENGGY